MYAQGWTRYKGTREPLSTWLFPLTFGGFFFGVLAYLVLGIGLGFSGLAALGMGVLCGLAFGLVLGGTSWLFHRSFSGRAGLLLAGGLVAGAAAGALISVVATANPPRGAWTLLPAPPEPAASLVDAARLGIYGQEIYVQAASGELYGYACLNWLLCNWRFVPQLPADALPSGTRADCRVASGGAEASAPAFLETRDFHFCLPGARVYLETGRQAGGEIYVWEYVQSTLVPGQVVLLFTAIGAVLGIGSLYLLVRNRRLPVDEMEAEPPSEGETS